MGNICTADQSKRLEEISEVPLQDRDENNENAELRPARAAPQTKGVDEDRRSELSHFEPPVFSKEELLMREFDEKIQLTGRYISEEEMQESIDQNVKNAEASIGPLKIPEEEQENFFSYGVFSRGPILFNNGTIYNGQWNYSGQRHGHGVFVRKDGSKYEGSWREDRIIGFGRFIDINGSYYEGKILL